MPRKHLLIIYHSKTGSYATLARAVLRGAKHKDIDFDVRFMVPLEANYKDLLWADGVIFGTPENFGYMSGILKDFFDRTFYEVEGKVDGLPFAVFISAGTDGQGALDSIRRICRGYKFREVQEPLVIVGNFSDSIILKCEELGMSMAAGIENGIF